MALTSSSRRRCRLVTAAHHGSRLQQGLRVADSRLLGRNGCRAQKEKSATDEVFKLVTSTLLLLLSLAGVYGSAAVAPDEVVN